MSGGKIVGEAKKYDPYSRFGSIMMYEMDSFGYVLGYVSGDVKIMSETDLRSDNYLRKELEETLYQNWKRRNVSGLVSEYDRMCRNREFFETFCRRIYEDNLGKETDG